MGIGIPAGWEIFNGGCPPIETVGACCLPGGSCTSVTEDQCVSLDGVYLGDGEICSPDPCEGMGGTIPPAAAGTSSATFQSCENVFSRSLYLPDACNWSDPVGDPPNLSPYFYGIDFQGDITVSSNSVTPCYGITYTQGPGLAIGEFMECLVTFTGYTGTPSAGICWSSSGTGTTNVNTYAIISDFNTGITRFVVFSNTNISSYNNGTTLYSASFLPSPGDYFWCQMFKDVNILDPPFPGEVDNGLFPAIYSATDTLLWGPGDYIEVNAYPLNNLGLIATGDATGTMTFKNPATSCQDLGLFIQIWQFFWYPPDV